MVKNNLNKRSALRELEILNTSLANSRDRLTRSLSLLSDALLLPIFSSTAFLWLLLLHRLLKIITVDRSSSLSLFRSSFVTSLPFLVYIICRGSHLLSIFEQWLCLEFHSYETHQEYRTVCWLSLSFSFLSFLFLFILFLTSLSCVFFLFIISLRRYVSSRFFLYTNL